MHLPITEPAIIPSPKILLTVAFKHGPETTDLIHKCQWYIAELIVNKLKY